MTTWNSRRSRPARISPSSRFELGLGLRVAELADHALGLVRLDGRGLDHVGRDRRGREPLPADRDRQASRPSQAAPIAIRMISDDQERQARARATRRANRSCISFSELTSQAASPSAAPTRMTVNAT